MEKKIQNVGAVILAAGKSTRMKSKINKLVSPFEGKPLVQRVIDACQAIRLESTQLQKIILVVGPDSTEIQDSLGDTVLYAIQHQRLGTGHALMQSKPLISEEIEHIVVLAGDHPFVTPECLEHLITSHLKETAAATILTAVYEEPPAYGRIIRDNAGNILRIVEQKDATEAEKNIREVNISTYCFQVKAVLPLLSTLQANNVQEEYYLTDIIELLLKQGEQVQAIPYHDNCIGVGINNRVDLAKAYSLARNKHLEKLMLSGVTIIDPNSTFIDSSVEIGNDTTIYPFTYLENGTKIGSDCKIGPHVKITNSTIADEVTIEFAVIEDHEIITGEKIGPFVHLKSEK